MVDRGGGYPRLPASVQQDGSYGPRSRSGAQALFSAPSPPLPAFARGARSPTPWCPAHKTQGREEEGFSGFADPQVTSLEGQLLVLLGLSGATGEQVTSLPPASG